MIGDFHLQSTVLDVVTMSNSESFAGSGERTRQKSQTSGPERP